MPSLITAPHIATILTDHRMDEYDDIIELLMDHRHNDSEEIRRIVVWIAEACMGNQHLWQDMQLPNRLALTALIQHHFPAIAAKNTGDMKWKKFFYRQLCERAEIPICKSPSCNACVDYDKCFDNQETTE